MISDDKVELVIKMCSIVSDYTIIAVEIDGKKKNLWVDVKDVEGKSFDEVKSMLNVKLEKLREKQ